MAWFKKGFFLGIQNNLKIRASACVSQSVSKCKTCNKNDSKVARHDYSVLHQLMLSGHF